MENIVIAAALVLEIWMTSFIPKVIGKSVSKKYEKEHELKRTEA